MTAIDLLKLAVQDAEERYHREYRSVNIHNNLDGVGIHFDYASYPSLPKWVEPAKALITSAEQEK